VFSLQLVERDVVTPLHFPRTRAQVGQFGRREGVIIRIGGVSTKTSEQPPNWFVIPLDAISTTRRPRWADQPLNPAQNRRGGWQPFIKDLIRQPVNFFLGGHWHSLAAA
jgi:hypothetical protein